MSWFDVDKEGLAKLLAARGKAFIIHELVQNAWDQNVSMVIIRLMKLPGDRYATIEVEDDDPRGFARLSDAFTMFAESDKKVNPEQRGRFNIGEKEVLALCESAEISTTTGTVSFDAKGRHRSNRKRIKGSVFSGRIKLTVAEFDECIDAARRLLPPAGITTTLVINDIAEPLAVQTPVRRFEATLATEIADAEGVLRRSVRKTTVEVFEPCLGETAMLFEMGIPVVETGDKYHVNVGQKVPLNRDRDNVTPAYLRDLRTVVLNATHDLIGTSEDANAAWARDAMSDPKVEVAAIQTMAKLRFGENAVSFSPSDPESNKRSMAEGRPVVFGAQNTAAEWANYRRAEVLVPAHKVTPSPKPYSDDPDAPPVKVIPWESMTKAAQRVVLASKRIGKALLGFEPEVQMVHTTNSFNAAYGRRCLDFNLLKLGHAFFNQCAEEGRLTERAIDLLIHEFGHEYCGDHLSAEYYRALTKLGAKLTLLVADQGGDILRV